MFLESEISFPAVGLIVDGDIAEDGHTYAKPFPESGLGLSWSGGSTLSRYLNAGKSSSASELEKRPGHGT